MKLKRELLIKKWLSLMLVFLVLLTSMNITSYAETQGGTTNGGPGGTIPSSTGKGDRNILRSYGAMIGIHRNPNTGAAYSDVINAHNTGMTNGKVWDECLFSCVEQNLYKYPQHFLNQGCVENNAVILINKNTNPITKPLHYVTDTGAISEKPFCNYYVARRQDEGNLTWSPIVIRDRIESDPKLLHAFQTYSLDIDTVKSLVASSQMDANIAAFVSLWGKAANVSKTINSMYKEGPEYYYDNLLKYLDLLCIVNEMCNGAYWDEIEDFLRTLNQDGSSDFISVYAASLVWVQPTNVTSVYTLFTLPNLYGACTGLGYSPFLKFTGQNSEISVDAHSPGGAGSYELTGTSWEAALMNQYNGVNNGRAARLTDLWGNNRDLVWWSKEIAYIAHSFDNYAAAQMLYPKDTYDFGTGNLGYTYFTTGGLNASKSIAPKPTSPPAKPSPDKDLEQEEVVGVFGLTAKTDTYMVAPGGIVQADIYIDLTQQEAYQRLIRHMYTKELELGGKTAKVEMELDFEAVEGSGDSGNHYDVLVEGDPMALAGDKILMPAIEYKDLEPFIIGDKQIHMVDAGISISCPSTNKYKATLTITWPKSGYEMKFFSQGRVIEDEYTASDSVSWVCEEPDKGFFYSAIRDGNFAEIKDGSPCVGETFEAMAGIPTTENLYLQFGVNEFMCNLETELGESFDNKRIYTLEKTFENCIGENDKCEYYCSGHTITVTSGHTASCKTKSYSKKFYCGSSQRTETVTCTCGASATGVIPAATWDASNSGKRCKSVDPRFPDPCTGIGCKVRSNASHPRAPGNDHATNAAHPHIHNFKGEIKQKIQDFTYIDITAEELWWIDKLNWNGNKDLSAPYKLAIDTETGWRTFYKEAEYQSGNGRLAFDYSLKDEYATVGEEHYGDTKWTFDPNSEVLLFTECDELATDEFNLKLENKTVKCSVISDFLSLCTTEGYQVPSWYKYTAPEVPILETLFTKGSAEKFVKGTDIIFTEIPTWDQLWKENSYSAFTWKPDHITRSGYNGKYDSPATKNNNQNITVPDDPAMFNPIEDRIGIREDHPCVNASNIHDGSTEFEGKNRDNDRFRKEGINILDSNYSSSGKPGFSSSPSGQYVKNGLWNTGHCYIHGKKVVEYNNPSGQDYSNYEGKDYLVEAGYTNGKRKVNNIVVHNPVSVQGSTVHAMDSMYDKRVEDDLEKGGDPEKEITGKCPGNL